MHHVETSNFLEFEHLHCVRIEKIVAPAMLLEAVCVFLLLLYCQTGFESFLAFSGLLCLAIIWWSTFTIQMPIHKKLELGRDVKLLAQLVRTNWIRTFAWSVRAVIAFALAWQKASVPIAGILLVAHLVCFTSMLPKAAGLLEESA